MLDEPAIGEPTAAGRRRAVALAGHTKDEPRARRGLVDPEPAVRATALGALARLESLTADDLTGALADPAAPVRRRACELVASVGPAVLPALVTALDDVDDRVVEAACFGLGELGLGELGLGGLGVGELGPDAAKTAAVAALCTVAVNHRDPLCRETAVATLGAIGDPAGLGAVLASTADKPAVRRRAILALAPFEGPEVDAALAAALTDRDWQVRQAAEDLGGGAT